VLRTASVDGCCSRRVWTGAARGECGENVESFFSRGRSAYVGFSCLLLLAPVRGGTSFLFKREKKRSKETRFKPPTLKCRRCSLQVFGPNVVRLPQPQPAVEHQSFSRAARTRFASTAVQQRSSRFPITKARAPRLSIPRQTSHPNGVRAVEAKRVRGAGAWGGCLTAR